MRVLLLTDFFPAGEFRRFCPVIRALRMGGTKEERQRVVNTELTKGADGKYKFDVLVTSYEGILREKNKLKNIPWEYLIIDEAHRKYCETKTGPSPHHTSHGFLQVSRMRILRFPRLCVPCKPIFAF